MPAKKKQDEATVVEEPKDEKKVQSAGDDVVETVLKTVEEMTVLQLSKLVKAMEDRFGVSAAVAPMAMAAAPGAAPAAEAAEAAEEKTEFDVELKDAGSQKIQVIKVVRQVTSLGLKEAKDLVDGAPAVVKEAVSKDEAQKLKEDLEAVGATVELK